MGTVLFWVLVFLVEKEGFRVFFGRRREWEFVVFFFLDSGFFRIVGFY